MGAAGVHLTVVTLHVVVSVHGHHMNGCLTALEKEADSHVCSLDLKHYVLSIKAALSTMCHPENTCPSDKDRAIQHVPKTDVYVPWATSPAGVTHRHVTVRKSHGFWLMQELPLPAMFLRKLT